MDTAGVVVSIENKKIARGMSLRDEISRLRPGACVLARALLSSVSFLNFVHWVVPGCFRHLRSGRDISNESGVMEMWRRRTCCGVGRVAKRHGVVAEGFGIMSAQEFTRHGGRWRRIASVHQ